MMTELADRLLPATTHDLHDANFAGRINLGAALTQCKDADRLAEARAVRGGTVGRPGVRHAF
jgi:hypothetical protein